MTAIAAKLAMDEAEAGTDGGVHNFVVPPSLVIRKSTGPVGQG
jgi:DNA-binding LacI/PurR family transcriptional regulator